MGCSIEQRWKPLVKYLYYLGVRREGMKRMLVVKPMIFCVDLETTIAPKVNIFFNFFCWIIRFQNVQFLLMMCFFFLLLWRYVFYRIWAFKKKQLEMYSSSSQHYWLIVSTRKSAQWYLPVLQATILLHIDVLNFFFPFSVRSIK